MSRVRSGLYRWARLLGDAEAVSSGDPKRIGRRVVNKALGRRVVARLWRR